MLCPNISNSFHFFLPVSVFPQRDNNWVVEFQFNNRFHINTRICPFILFKLLLHISRLWFLTVSAYVSIYSSSLSPSPSDAAAATLGPDIYSPFCYHHLLATHSYDICTVYLHRSIIVRITIYCATAFCLFGKYSTISSNPASCISISIGGYSQLPPACCFGCLPVIRLDTLCWNPPRDRPMRGVTNHVSDPKRSTACKTVLQNIPDTPRLAPSLPSILVSQGQTFCAF